MTTIPWDAAADFVSPTDKSTIPDLQGQRMSAARGGPKPQPPLPLHMLPIVTLPTQCHHHLQSHQFDYSGTRLTGQRPCDRPRLFWLKGRSLSIGDKTGKRAFIDCVSTALIHTSLCILFVHGSGAPVLNRLCRPTDTTPGERTSVLGVGEVLRYRHYKQLPARWQAAQEVAQDTLVTPRASARADPRYRCCASCEPDGFTAW